MAGPYGGPVHQHSMAACNAAASSPSQRVANTSAPSAWSQGPSIGPSASRMSQSCGSPERSNSSPSTNTSARGLRTVTNSSYPAAAARPNTAGVTSVPAGNNWSPLPHSWPLGRMSCPG